MTIRTVLATSALCGCVAAPAFAADLPYNKAPPPPYVPPPPILTWNGLYVGLNAGGAWDARSTALSGPQIAPTANPSVMASLAGTVSPNSGGFLGGGQIGYNWQFSPSFLVGLEADIQGASGGGGASTGAVLPVFSLATGAPAGSVLSSVDVTKRLDYLGTVRGRVGFLIAPTLLLFGTGGLAYGGVGLNSSATLIHYTNAGVANVAAFSNAGYSDTRVGWTAGGGAEWMFMPNWSAKVEYLYYDLGSVATDGLFVNTQFGVGAGLGSHVAQQSATRFDGHVARAGVNYHFNWGAPAPVYAKY